MKTKELIRLLKEADPSGEEEVSIGNRDIAYVENLPSFYDGCQVVFDRVQDGCSYDIERAIVRANGRKIKIATLDIDDVLWSKCDLIVEYDSDYARSQYESSVEEMRAESTELKDKHRREDAN